MQNREKLPNSEANTETNNNPWADMAETAPLFNPDQENAKEPKIPDEEVARFATDQLSTWSKNLRNELNRDDLEEKERISLEFQLDRNDKELEIWDEVETLMDGSTNIPDILVKMQKEYENQGKLLHGERGREAMEKARSIRYMDGTETGRSYEFWVQRAADDREEQAKQAKREEAAKRSELYQEQNSLEQLRRAKLEAMLRRDINVDVLLSEGDEELAHLAKAIDNTTFAMPGQEEAADRRLEQAKRKYQLAKESRDAEREVLGWMQDDDVHRYSQEELIARLDDFQHGTLGVRSIDDVKERMRLGRACDRLRGRLEKFVLDVAEDLSDKDWEYWDKITGVAKKVSPEDLVPKTLSKDGLAYLLGRTTEAGTTAKDAAEGPLPAEDEEMRMEDIPTGKTREQIEADKAKATVHIDGDFRRRMQEYNESLRRR